MPSGFCAWLTFSAQRKGSPDIIVEDGRGGGLGTATVGMLVSPIPPGGPAPPVSLSAHK